jgi:hypothetical protein
MDVSDPVSEKLQRSLSFSASLALLDDRTSKSFLIAVTTQADAPGQVSEWSPSESLGRFMNACSLPWVIRPRAGITEGFEPLIVADQFPDLGARVGLDQAHDRSRLEAAIEGVTASAMEGQRLWVDDVGRKLTRS